MAPNGSVVTEDDAYQQIFQGTTDGLVVNDPETGLVVEVNPAFCEMHGYAYEELIGAHPAIFIHPDDHALFGRFVESFREGRPFQARARDVRKDGSVFEVEVRASSFLYRGRHHLLGVVRDVSLQAAAVRELEQRVDERTRMLEALLDVSRLLASALEPADVARIAVEQATTAIGADSAGLYVLDRADLALLHAVGAGYAPVIPQRAVRTIAGWLGTGGTLVLPTGGEAPTIEARAVGLLRPASRALIVPMLNGGDVVGMLVLNRHDCPRDVPEPHVIAIAHGVADQTALALVNARLHAAARRSAALEERHRIARDLHDSVSQTLFSTTMHARAAELALEGTCVASDHALRRHVRDVADLTRGSLAEMRALIFELRPGALAEEGLGAALRKHAGAIAARHQLRVEVTVPDDRLPLSADSEEELYRLAQEALANVVKHASADGACVAVALVDDRVELVVRDDGAGFDGRERPGHFGLRTMRERADRLRGTLAVESTPAGTRVTVSVPVGVQR